MHSTRINNRLKPSGGCLGSSDVRYGRSLREEIPVAKILYVEDDRDLAKSLKEWLEVKNFSVDMAFCAEEAHNLLAVNDYDLIILDWNLPDGDGVSICRSYRAKQGNALVLLLTSRSSTDEKVEGLEAGADDYLTKPFQSVELLARLRALLRRDTRATEVLSYRELEVNPVAHTVKMNGKELKLSPQEFALLEFFMRHPDEVFSTDALLKRVWSGFSEAGPDTVRVTINRLRSKMNSKEVYGSRIKSLYGVGYVLTYETESN